MRRCTTGACLATAGARHFDLDLPLATILANPRHDWLRIATGDGRIRVARDIQVDWSEFTPERYLISHCSIVSSVAVEDNGYYILPASSELVNSNGNAWVDPVLMATFRTFVGAENYLEHCFPAGTRVLMADGTYKDIQDVSSGERVVNRLGEIGVVKNIQKRKSSEFVVLESPKIISRKLRVTGNHPFWVMSAKEICPKTGRLNTAPRKRKRPDPKWSGYSVGVHGKESEAIPCGWEGRWVDAANLNTERDILTLPMSNVETEHGEINKNRAELIGWFLAEGSYGTSNIFVDGESSVQFSLSANESQVAERIKSLLISEFGDKFRADCEPRIYEMEYKGQPSYIILTLSNLYVKDFFLRWCGKYSWSKRMADELMWISKDLQATILHSYLAGDGCDKIEFRGYVAATASRDLAHQMSFVANRLGLHPCVKEDGLLPRYSECIEDGKYPVYMDPNTGKKRRPEHLLRFTVGDSIRLDEMVGAKTNFTYSNSKKPSSLFDGKWFGFWFEKSAERISQPVDVFNLEIEGDNSYIAEGVAVHNCQLKEMSKGKILDAVARPVRHVDSKGRECNVHFIDILVATDRKHTSLVGSIESGKMATLSMGCLCNHITCSRCGKVLADNDPNCEHIEHQLLTSFIDENGIERIVSELCGRMLMKNGILVPDPESNKFIEASWVERPAFTGAVLNHYVTEIPKLANVIAFSTSALEETVEDLFKLRVADKTGMIVLRVAREELMRRKREDMINRIACSRWV
jgi:hypothetical protein